MTIFFRSLRAQHMRKGESRELVRLSGNDWNSLQEYSAEDDARNIFWRKSTGERIYTKERRDTGSFSLYTLFLENSGDDFYSQQDPISRKSFHDTIQQQISRSAETGGHRYKKISQGHEFLVLKPRNSLVFIISSNLGESLSQSIQTLAHHNDVIFLHVLHPFEIDGGDYILFDGKKLDTDRYKSEFEIARKSTQKSIIHTGASYIAIKTNEDFEKKMNYFFKHRFQYG